MSLDGMKVVVTGKFSRGRKEIEAELEDAGADVTGSVSGKTQLLICGEDAGSKLAKAEKLGLPIINEGQMEQLLAGKSLDKVLKGGGKAAATKPAKKAVKKKAAKKSTTKKAAPKKAAKGGGGGSLAGMKVVVTGKFAASRKEMKAALEALGADVTGSFSGKTQLLVCGEDAGSKLSKAQAAGTPIIDEYGYTCLVKGESLEEVLRYDAIFE